MINAAIPILQDEGLFGLLRQILLRAIDGTVKPLFVDTTNQRVIVGGTVSAGQNSAFQVQGSDIELTTDGKGIILRDLNGSGRVARVTAIRNADTGSWSLDVTGLT